MRAHLSIYTGDADLIIHYAGTYRRLAFSVVGLLNMAASTLLILISALLICTCEASLDRPASVVEVIDRHVFQTEYPNKDQVLHQMAKNAYVEILCQGCVFGDESCSASKKFPF